MDYRYTELVYAKNIYENGFQSVQHRPTELRLVATYMRRNLNYKPKKLKEEMEQWCETHITGYKKELYYKMINTAINQACKKGSKLINIDRINFYQYEMDYINNLHIIKDKDTKEESEYSYECKKVIFTLLFKMKVNKIITELKSEEEDFIYKGKYFQGGQKKYTELKKLAKIRDKVKINEDIIHSLWISGYVSPMFHGLVKLNFMEELYGIEINPIPPDQSIAIKVTDYESVGWYFDYYNKDSRITFCKRCGKIFRKKSNRQEYCSEVCSSTVNRNKTKKRMEKIRSSSIV